MKAKLSGLVVALLAVTLIPAELRGNERLYQQVSHSIVFISTDTGFGSGIVVKSSGLILTNLHVVRGHRNVTIAANVLCRGRIAERELPGRVLSAHKDYDAALVKVKLPAGGKLKAIPFAKGPLRTGSSCFAIGNPGLGREPMKKTMTPGMVSKASQEVEGLDYVQTTAPVNPGNSGGALVNANGELIGIVTFKATQVEGISFAVPAAEIQPDDFAAEHLDRRVEAYDTSLLSQMSAAGIGMLFLGLALMFVGWFWLVVVAFKTHVMWGIALLVFRIAAVAFLFVNWADAKVPFAIATVGVFLAVGSFFVGLR